MNAPPSDGRRVPVEDLRDFVAGIFAAVPVPAADAVLIADLLIDTELRGVVSHGVLQVERYVTNFK
ncbi:Ldh family oxidoreductase, partial [bacterium]|nr:Ldh family oxidoreductase [bacterium]